MNTLSILSQALANAAPNREQDFARAHAMYAAYFRSEPFLLSNVEASCLPYVIQDVKKAKARSLLAEQGIKEPVFCCDYDDDNSYYEGEAEFEAYDNQVEELAKTLDFDQNTLVCDLCNYKGEGEGGIVPFEDVKHLPVFKDKSASAAYFNI